MHYRVVRDRLAMRIGMRIRGAGWMVLAASVVVPPFIVGADDSRVVIESLAPTILGDYAEGVDGKPTSHRGAETEGESSSAKSQPGWASSFARSSSSSG